MIDDPERAAEDDELERHLVQELVQIAGPRPAPSAAAYRQARTVARAAWHEGRRSGTRVYWPWAAAAAVALAVFGLPRLGGVHDGETTSTVSPAPRSPSVASLQIVRGDVRLDDGGVVRAGLTIAAGLALDTHDGRAALKLTSGTGVRLDRHSRVRFLSAERLRLERGALYVDSGPGGRSGLLVETPVGSARDVGTQFELRVDGAALRVRVREGVVNVERQAHQDTAQAGEELSVSTTVTRRAVPTHGGEWAWMMDVAPAFELEGRSADALLRWAAREGGWKLVYAEARLTQVAERCEAHGVVDGLSVDEALRAVLPTCDLGYELRDGRLRVSGPAAARPR